ncbi:sodium-dependent bicarbonate transport family permease [Shewanella sp. SR43-8]|nr:sodium-dependent bicarbonate transport family permease [Shewanella sp. SR43-8]
MKSDLKVPKATCKTLSTLLMLILGIAEGMTRQKKSFSDH